MNTSRTIGRLAAAGLAGAAVARTKTVTDQELAANRVRDAFNRVQGAAQLSTIYNEIGNIESSITELPQDLQELRDRGYVHSGRLEERIQALQRQWRRIQSRVDAALRTQTNRLRMEMNQTAQVVNRISVRRAGSISAARAAVDGLDRQVSAAQHSISGLYDDLHEELRAIEANLRQVSRMLDIIAASPEIHLRPAEGPLLAGEAEWERDGEEGPDGFIILTDQRLIFEQKEEVATRKLFGIFAQEKETIQRLIFDVPVFDVEQVAASEEGGFLGFGKDDILEIIFGPAAPVTRARFHIQGQESTDWATWINRARAGELDQERHAAYAQEVAEIAAVAHKFPTQCPHCFAPLPTPARGMMTITCEFCGSILKPEE
jgi:chaperonin cofactor prefoldin